MYKYVIIIIMLVFGEMYNPIDYTSFLVFTTS